MRTTAPSNGSLPRPSITVPFVIASIGYSVGHGLAHVTNWRVNLHHDLYAQHTTKRLVTTYSRVSGFRQDKKNSIVAPIIWMEGRIKDEESATGHSANGN